MKQLYHRLLGLAYAFTYQTSRRRFLGIGLRTWVIVLSWIPLALAWQQRWGITPFFLALALALAVPLAYWRASRVGYSKFVSAGTAVPQEKELVPLPANQRVSLLASGVFGVNNTEERVLFRPAEYWQVPLGEHTVMVQESPGRFVYQFFQAEDLQYLEHGVLIHGVTPRRALALTFRTSWGADIPSLKVLYQTTDDGADPKKKVRTVYFCFDDENDERAVWHNIVYDARQARSDAT